MLTYCSARAHGVDMMIGTVDVTCANDLRRQWQGLTPVQPRRKSLDHTAGPTDVHDLARSIGLRKLQVTESALIVISILHSSFSVSDSALTISLDSRKQTGRSQDSSRPSRLVRHEASARLSSHRHPLSWLLTPISSLSATHSVMLACP